MSLSLIFTWLVRIFAALAALAVVGQAHGLDAGCGVPA
jgi:hypothetical protein